MRLTVGTKTRTVSLWRLYCGLTRLSRRFQGDKTDRRSGKRHGDHLEAVVGLLAELGFPGCSHLLAIRFVAAVNGVIERLRRKGWGREKARLARAYGGGVLGGNPRPRDYLMLALHESATWAEMKLRDTPGLTADSIRSLTLLATGSQESADDAWAKAAMREMRAGLTPAG